MTFFNGHWVRLIALLLALFPIISTAQHFRPVLSVEDVSTLDQPIKNYFSTYLAQQDTLAPVEGIWDWYYLNKAFTDCGGGESVLPPTMSYRREVAVLWWKGKYQVIWMDHNQTFFSPYEEYFLRNENGSYTYHYRDFERTYDVPVNFTGNERMKFELRNTEYIGGCRIRKFIWFTMTQLMDQPPDKELFTIAGVATLLTSDGLMITPLDPLENANEVRVTDHSNEKYKAEMVKALPGENLMIIKGDIKNPAAMVSTAPAYHLKWNDLLFSPADLYAAVVRDSQSYVTGCVNEIKTIEGRIEWLRLYFDFGAPDVGSPLFNSKNEMIGVVSGRSCDTEMECYVVPIESLIEKISSTENPYDKLPLYLLEISR